MKKVRVFNKQGELIPDEVLEEIEDNFIRSRASKYSPRIAETLVRDLRETLIEGVREGERVSDLRNRLADVLVNEAPARLDRIVRTEVIGAMNAGSVEGYKLAGVRKEWMTARDAAVRGAEPDDKFSHIEVDGQVRDADEAFDVSGEQLMYPGDPSGSPGNIVNCRCTTVPVLSEEETE